MMNQTNAAGKHWLLGALLMMMFLCISTFPALAETKGVLDPLSGNSISGWAWDSSTPDTSLEVTVTVTSQTSGETVLSQAVTAKDHRDDLLQKGTGTGNYGFYVSLSLDTLPDGAYVVEAAANGQKLTNQRYYTPGASTQAANLKPLGVFKITSYCPCTRCSEGWGRNTSSGAMAVANHTIAVDPRVIPMGSKLVIDGITYTAEDRGGGVKGNHIDIYYNTHAETRSHGTTYSEVFLVQ